MASKCPVVSQVAVSDDKKVFQVKTIMIYSSIFGLIKNN